MSLTLSRITIVTYSIVPKNVFPDSVQSLEQENNIKLNSQALHQITKDTNIFPRPPQE